MNTRSKPNFSSYTPTEMRELFEKDAALFTELADDAIEQACIGKTPEQTLKLRQMQWTIASQLRKGKTPLGRMQIMENIFYGQVYGSNGQLAKLTITCDKFIRAIRGTQAKSSDKDGNN